MDKRYNPQSYEDKIYRLWEKTKAFTPKRNKKKSASRQTFTIIMPPPNANAPLHVGHVMFSTLEDIMIRFHRMLGSASLWLPGVDHAGILTQVVFERKLAKEGKTRFSLTRKNFYRDCLKFTQKNKKIMFDQLKKTGASCDWSRQKFTLDPKPSLEVLRTFIKLYNDKLAYRGERLINWCPRCLTALSDLEVEHLEIRSKLYYIKYPLKIHSEITGQKIFLIVATTRPETMLGDTAIAVNPQDDRYQQFVGQKAILPLVGREIPIVSDKNVDMEFGTGCVKVTPAHDPVDFEIGLKHKLPMISVINFNGKMTENCGPEYSSLKTLAARQKITEELDKLNLLIRERSFVHSVAHCERCKTIIEPLLSQQWFIKTSEKFKVKSAKLSKLLDIKECSLREMGSLAVKKGLIKIIPKRFKKNYLTWMKNLRDWCISRQIWWGHKLPIYYCGLSGLSPLQRLMNPKLITKIKNSYKKSKKINGCGHIMVAMKKPKLCPKCKGKIIIQDPDTFDTWFSSGQWAYNALGYPKGRDYKYFYPTTVMETGYEILPIWVAKMIMLSLYRTNEIPFKTVYLHGLVRDAFGQKMSKSKGNAINPMQTIATFGADALRLSLVIGSGAGNDVAVSEDKIRGYRNFSNKVWNIGRFLILSLGKKELAFYTPKLKNQTKQDRAIINELNQLIIQVTKDLTNYRFSPAAEAVYHFIWHKLADKYLESIKDRLKNNDKAAQIVLRHVYLNCLKLLHPFMPFITEACWQQFKGLKEKTLINASWPEV